MSNLYIHVKFVLVGQDTKLHMVGSYPKPTNNDIHRGLLCIKWKVLHFVYRLYCFTYPNISVIWTLWSQRVQISDFYCNTLHSGCTASRLSQQLRKELRLHISCLTFQCMNHCIGCMLVVPACWGIQSTAAFLTNIIFTNTFMHSNVFIGMC